MVQEGEESVDRSLEGQLPLTFPPLLIKFKIQVSMYVKIPAIFCILDVEIEPSLLKEIPPLVSKAEKEIGD